MKLEDYPIEIAPLPKDEGGGYLVTVPDLPGCIANGDTIESAVAEARDAFEAWARAELEDAGALPAPGTTYERLPRKEGAYETAGNEVIAPVLSYKRGLARADPDESKEPNDSPSRLKSARQAPSVAGAGSGKPATLNSERAGGVRKKHALRRLKVPEREPEMGADMDDNGDLRRLAELLDFRNANERELVELIGRPGEASHIGEFIAAWIFNIDLEPSANNPGYDGRFGSGPLAQKSVNVKFSPKWERTLDIGKYVPDYYLVLAGPISTTMSSKGTARPWAVDNVFLFEAKPLIDRLRERGVKIREDGTSVRSDEWERARIYPANAGKPPVTITENQQKQIGIFGSAKISRAT